jgi:hypothetical protein
MQYRMIDEWKCHDIDICGHNDMHSPALLCSTWCVNNTKIHTQEEAESDQLLPQLPQFAHWSRRLAQPLRRFTLLTVGVVKVC